MLQGFTSEVERLLSFCVRAEGNTLTYQHGSFMQGSS